MAGMLSSANAPDNIPARSASQNNQIIKNDVLRHFISANALEIEIVSAGGQPGNGDIALRGRHYPAARIVALSDIPILAGTAAFRRFHAKRNVIGAFTGFIGGRPGTTEGLNGRYHCSAPRKRSRNNQAEAADTLAENEFLNVVLHRLKCVSE